MQYKLTRVDPDAPNEVYPVGERETVSDPLLDDQVHKNIYMGKLADVLNQCDELLAALEIIAASEEFHGDSFVCGRHGQYHTGPLRVA